MKDSGVEWIGEIPEDWEIKRLKNITIERQGGVWGKDEDLNNAENNIVCIRVADFDYGKMTIRKDRELTLRNYTNKEISKYSLKKGDILVEKSGGGEKNPVGRTVIWNENFHALYANFLERLRMDKAQILPMFAQYCFYTNYGMGGSNLFFNQTTGIQNLDMNKMLNELEFPVPKLSSQAKIIDLLVKKIGVIESVKTKVIQEIQTLEEYKKSVITEAVTKGLDKNAEMKDSGIEWIGEIPKHWKVEKLKYLGISKNEIAIYKKGKRFIGLEHVGSFNGKIIGQDLGYDECDTPFFEKGDFLFSKLRPYLAKGFLAERGGFCTSELIRISFNEEQCNRFFKYLLLSHKFIDLINSMTYGVKMPRTSWQELREQYLTVPPSHEQEKIANYLDEKCGSIDEVIAIKQNQLSLLDEYKKSMIYEYVTGKREV